MGFFGRITGREAAEDRARIEVLREVAGRQAETIGLIEAREASVSATLELAVEDRGWERVMGGGSGDIARTTLQKMVDRAKLTYVLNPLINNAARIQLGYVFGQGFSVEVASEKLNDVVQAFWDDRGNRRALTRPRSLWRREITLQNTGNLFLALFTDAINGRVQVRTIPFDQVQEIITEPGDREKVLYFRRRWSEEDGIGRTEREALYPSVDRALSVEQRARAPKLGNTEIRWDSPVLHVKSGEIDDMAFGLPEMWSALDWARAVRDDMADHATIKRAHARFAWSLYVAGGGTGVDAAKRKLGTTLGDLALSSQPETNPPPVAGATFIASKGAADLGLIRTAGAAASPDESRGLRLMVAAGTGTPETMLTGDADVGNLATSKTLDRPTELRMLMRQELWKEVLTDLVEYVLYQAVAAPNGKLKGLGTVKRDETGYSVVEWKRDPSSEAGAPYDAHVDITFPDLLERDVKTRVDAVVSAFNTGLLDETLARRELLTALGVDDIDEEIQRMEDEAEATIDAAPAAAATAELAAAARELSGHLRRENDRR